MVNTPRVFTFCGVGTKAPIFSPKLGKERMFCSMMRPCKKFACVLLALLLAVGLLPLSVLAETAQPQALPAATPRVATVYRRVTEENLPDGEYAIVAHAGSRILYHDTTEGDTNQVTGSISGDVLTLDSKYTADKQLWTLTKSGDGYTLKSNSGTDMYLDLSQVTTSKSKVNNTACVMTVSKDADNKYSFRYTDDSGTVHSLAHSDNGGQQFCTISGETATGMQTSFYLFRNTVYHRVSAETLAEGEYAIVSETKTADKVLYHADTQNRADQLDVSVTDDLMSLHSGFTADKQLWTLTKNGDGYTLKSNSGTDMCLDLSVDTDGASAGNSVKVTANATQALTIKKESDGKYSISYVDGDGTKCRGHRDHSRIP